MITAMRSAYGPHLTRSLLRVLIVVALGGVSFTARAVAGEAWRVSVFQADVTPPIGHPLLAISSSDSRARRIEDPLSARGFVLHGPRRAIVLVGVDWCELRNDAYARWREVLAQAAGTTPARVLVSCLHQHDAPYFDLSAQKLLAASPGGGMICDPEFHEAAVQRVARALKESLPASRNVTHVGLGRARVDRIASSRRIELPGGKVTFGRFSRSLNPEVRALPEGEIDPWLRTVSLWDGETPVVAVSAYACHPMSHYGSGDVSGDFINMARARREQDLPGVFQVYLTGCAGDVTAGKYNDGSKSNRPVLAERLHAAMAEAWRVTERRALETITCRSVPMLLPHGETPELQPDALRRQLADPQESFVHRVHAALGLSSFNRNPAGHSIDLQVIDFARAQLVLLPAETFVAHQLLAQRLRPDTFVMAVGFGECAPGYIPTDQAFREGFREEHGYCWVAPGAERIIGEALKKALAR